MCLGTYCDINSARQHNRFYYISNYIGNMFRLLNSHLQTYSLQVKSQDAVHCTHWDPSVFTSVKYLSQIIYLGK